MKWVMAHESHITSDEGLEGCLLCGILRDSDMQNPCEFAVIERAELERLQANDYLTRPTLVGTYSQEVENGSIVDRGRSGDIA